MQDYCLSNSSGPSGSTVTRYSFFWSCGHNAHPLSAAQSDPQPFSIRRVAPDLQRRLAHLELALLLSHKVIRNIPPFDYVKQFSDGPRLCHVFLFFAPKVKLPGLATAVPAKFILFAYLLNRSIVSR